MMFYSLTIVWHCEIGARIDGALYCNIVLHKNYDRLPRMDCRICCPMKLSNRITSGLLVGSRALLVGSAGA